MRLFHIATAADWEQAQREGRYTTSTYGVSLAEEGFIHASRADQWQGVRERFYATVTEPLVLLVIDPDLLDVPVVEESPPGSAETFPHLYGALDPAAVVQVLPLGTGTGTGTATHPYPDPSPATAHTPVTAPTASTTTPAPTSSESFSRLFFNEMFHNVMLAVLVLVCVAVGAVAGRSIDDDWGALLGTAAGLLVGLPLAVLVHRRTAPS